MEIMAAELAEQGHDVAFVTINQASSSTAKTLLTDSCSFPVFQDTAEMNAWALYEGKKDDMYVYRSDHTLHAYLTLSGTMSIALQPAGGTGYENVKAVVLEALSAE
jgi:hypothetical protein